MDVVLTVRAARKRFGDTCALDGADVELRRGEWLALLGPNGAGKTTLVRALAGRVALDAGTMTLLGQTLDGTPAAGQARRRLGIVPQEIALYPLLTARENLEVFGALQGLDRPTRRERIDRALEWTGLADRAGDLAKTFSGGMKRRLNLACGVLHEPDVVLLDEPTVGVDPQSRERIWEMLEDLRRRGASLLLTTHQLDEAQQVCDRITIIDHGRAIAAGTFEELLAQTIGRQRRVRIAVDGPVPVAIDATTWERVDDATLLRGVDDVATELPGLLAELGGHGCRVVDVHIDAPNLQAVFIHLTGRELRE